MGGIEGEGKELDAGLDLKTLCHNLSLNQEPET